MKDNKQVIPLHQEERQLQIKAESMFFDIARFEHAQRIAKMFSTSTMVPVHFKDNIGNCLIALNYADRVKADVFMVMQSLYVVHGRPGIEAKLAIALLNSSGKFTPLRFRYNDEKTECAAYATDISTQEKCEGPTVSMKIAEAEGWLGKKGSKWKTMPELMLMYRSASFFIKTYAPEVLLGMQTKEELDDVFELKPAASGSFEVPKVDIDTSAFDRLASSQIDYPDTTLDRFISETAKPNDMTPDQLKVEAVKDFDNFWKGFESWRKKTYQERHTDFKDDKAEKSMSNESASDIEEMLSENREAYVQACKQFGRDPETDDDVEKVVIIFQEITG